jgi:hypothetical protein
MRRYYWWYSLIFCLLLLSGVASASSRRYAESRSSHQGKRTPLARPVGAVRSAGARLVRVRSEHRSHAHTARALRRARRHGTEAVRAAARSETAREAREQSTVDTASAANLRLPEKPLAIMNLPPLRGSHESLVRQNERAEQDGLLRVKDDADLVLLRSQGSLVALPELAALHSDERLPPLLPYLDGAIPGRPGAHALPALPHPAPGELCRAHR